MTDTTTTVPSAPSVPSVPLSPLSPDDPRTLFASAVRTGRSVIGGVRPDQFGVSTPCGTFDVRELLGHLVTVLRRVAGLGRGEDFLAGFDDPVDVDDDEWLAAWMHAAHAVQTAWTDDAVLQRTISLPWMTAPGGDILLSYLSELTVHTWDLARATGQSPAWDERVIEHVASGLGGMPATGRSAMFAEVRQHMPEQYRSAPEPFADAVPVPDDSPAIDRIVAWSGRHPGWARP